MNDLNKWIRFTKWFNGLNDLNKPIQFTKWFNLTDLNEIHFTK